ncbi:MAG: zinc dependent phospholipase C family protein [Ignavibacteriales bacterium]
MLYQSHLFFSKITYDNMLCNNHIKLSKSGFKYGNIKPDLLMNFKVIPHNFLYSAGFIIEQINLLIDETDSLDYLESSDFAIKLGVIDHYVSDFFCMPHNKGFVKISFLAHVIYEKRLDSICKQIKKRKLKKYLYKNMVNVDGNISDILQMRYDIYNKEEYSVLNDILFAIESSILVNNFVIKACISKINSHAA